MWQDRFSGWSGLAAAPAALVVMAAAQPVQAASARDVAKVAVPTTVQIVNVLEPSSSGSGAIISQDGETYFVLTADHVVQNPNTAYQIVTSKKVTYEVKEVKRFRQGETGTDLAIVTFETKDELSIAPLANSDETGIGSGVYVSGYAAPSQGQTEAEYAFTNGVVNNVRTSDPEGYNLRYDAVTRKGMSGGPVFDVSGRIVGVHGRGEGDGAVSVESGGVQGQVSLKTGFNNAIPVNVFLARAEEMGVKKEQLSVDDKPPANEDADEVKPGEAKGWFNEFASNLIRGLGERLLRRLLPW
ncbi:serine protease [Limnothrix sp. PR1529]|uniref:S1 family peptidase n=1 Tax=Limnothrix sp. PR1529 TaxID=1704291 RepID=UPI00081F3985|nr:serine protease [Limnothrix sp. PR1529]OCQ96455.1 hypothetical protein BCR12_11180 [Limnothrix sp. P13C2]